jgi:serine/threonine protein kinase
MIEGQNDYVHTRLASFVERRRMMASFVADSNVLNRKSITFAPTIESKNIEVGRVLGSGGFSNVKSIRSLPTFATDSNQSLLSDDSTCANPRNFAFKTLRNDLSQSTKRLGALDLQKEAQILSILKHKNIVSIHSASSFEEDYFLVIEKLDTCVDKKILEWKNILRFIKKTKVSKETKLNQVNDILHTRLICCLQISSGVSYLHEKK